MQKDQQPPKNGQNKKENEISCLENRGKKVQQLILKMNLRKRLQFYQMQALQGYSVREKARCLAEHRVRARVIKDTFIRQGYIKKEIAVTRQVVKYSTLLSQKMLDKVKTEELKQFKQNVQEYCKQLEKTSHDTSNQVSSTFKSVNFSQMFSDLKDHTKDKMRNEKKRRKTVQNFDKKLFISPEKQTSMIKQQQQRRKSPLVNSKLKEAIQKTKKKKGKARFHLNGKNINSQIVHLLDKLQEIDSIQKLRNRRECLHDEEYQQYLHQRSKHLKRQKQRLSTAFENHQRHKFKPIGRIRREPVSKNESKYQLDPLSDVKKINSPNRAVILKPIKRSQIIISSSEISQTLLNQDNFNDQRSIKYRSRSKNRIRGNSSLEELAIQRERASSNLQIVPQKNIHPQV